MQIKLPLNTVQQMMKQAGSKEVKVGKKPAIVMKEYLEQVLDEVTVKAKMITKARNKSTVSDNDVRVVVELLK